MHTLNRPNQDGKAKRKKTYCPSVEFLLLQASLSYNIILLLLLSLSMPFILHSKFRLLALLDIGPTLLRCIRRALGKRSQQSAKKPFAALAFLCN
jgi:hypothetical protein